MSVATEHPALDLVNVTIDLHSRGRRVNVVDDVGLSIDAGEIVGLVGESGSGKSVTCLAILDLLGHAFHVEGDVRVAGEIGGTLGNKSRRGRAASMIFQDPTASLNPISTIGHQLIDAVGRLRGVDGSEARAIAIDLLTRVGLPEPEVRLRQYPFQQSGGQNQRVMIALALAGNPRLLIADEPTTALDVTMEAQILRLLDGLRTETGMGILLVTHDLGVVAQICDRVAVMYAGRIVEQGSVADILDRPRHPYTRGLIAAMPTMTGARRHGITGAVPVPGARPDGCAFAPRCGNAIDICRSAVPALADSGGGRIVACHNPEPQTDAKLDEALTEHRAETGLGQPLLELRGVDCAYRVRKPGRLFGRIAEFRAIRNVSLSLARGDSLAIIGESGSGKSTTAKLVMGMEPPSTGQVLFNGTPVPRLGTPAHRDYARSVQLIPQNPQQALDPRMHAGRQIVEPLDIHAIGTKRERITRMHELLSAVGLAADVADRYPHQMSGGQNQRLVIARALALKPKLLVCDEPTSALDVSVQAQIIELLDELRRRLDLALLFISHDLRVVRSLCRRVAVMHDGVVVEEDEAAAIFGAPRHPYTQSLVASIPDMSRARSTSPIATGGPGHLANGLAEGIAGP